MERGDFLSPWCMDCIVVLSKGISQRNFLRQADLRILRLCRSCYCRGQIPLLRLSVVFTASTDLHFGQGSRLSDRSRRCSREPLPLTFTGEFSILDMNLMSLHRTSTGQNTPSSTLALLVKAVSHGLGQRVNSHYGSCAV